MSTAESFNNGGIVVLREALDSVVAKDFQEEWLEALTYFTGNVLYEPLAERSSRHFGAGFNVNDLYVGNLTPHYMSVRLPATQRIFELWGGVREPGSSITVNQQGPGTAQVFHKDRRVKDDSVTVIHAGDNGAFDYAPLARHEGDAEYRHETIELSAGDIVLHRNPYIYHRGRNTGDATRITAVLSTFFLD